MRKTAKKTVNVFQVIDEQKPKVSKMNVDDLGRENEVESVDHLFVNEDQDHK